MMLGISVSTPLCPPPTTTSGGLSVTSTGTVMDSSSVNIISRSSSASSSSSLSSNSSSPSSASSPSEPLACCERRRKSVPLRSISRHDLSPGIHFRVVTDAVTLIGNSGYASRSSTSQGLVSDEWDWKMVIGGSQPTSNPLHHHHHHHHGAAPVTIRTSDRPRARSFSVGERASATADCHHNAHENMTESESDLAGSPTTYVHLAGKRRASISNPSGGAAINNGITVYTGSLAHLVPNQFLQTTSRRVSTHGSAPGCLCTSCSSTVTPYWRDGWAADVMLCNACGLRFQKFARRCPACMYIPRKEDSLGERCVKCNQLWVVGPC